MLNEQKERKGSVAKCSLVCCPIATIFCFGKILNKQHIGFSKRQNYPEGKKKDNIYQKIFTPVQHAVWHPIV